MQSRRTLLCLSVRRPAQGLLFLFWNFQSNRKIPVVRNFFFQSVDRLTDDILTIVDEDFHQLFIHQDLQMTSLFQFRSL